MKPHTDDGVYLSCVSVSEIIVKQQPRKRLSPVAQLIHLLMANLIFAVRFFLYICLGYVGKAENRV